MVAAINKGASCDCWKKELGWKEAEEIVKASQRNLGCAWFGKWQEIAVILLTAIFTNATDDDYYYGYGDVDDDVINDGEIELEMLQLLTVIRLNLADNSTQIVILQGVNATKLPAISWKIFF